MTDRRSALAFQAGLLLCGLLISVPFLNPHHYFPFPTFYAEWVAFAVGLAALGVMPLGSSRRPLPVPALTLGLFLLTGVLVLQAALGQVAYPLRSAMGALYATWAALIVMLGAWLANELGEATVSRSLQWWLAASGTAVAASGFFQFYGVPFLGGAFVVPQPINWMFGTIGQPNNFANYLGCGLVSVAFLHGRGSLSALPAALMALPIAAGMALSGSRASWGYMIIAFLLAALLRGASREEAGRILRLLCFALAVYVLAQVLNIATGAFEGPVGKPASSGERLARDLDMVSASGEHSIRLQLFSYAWRMFLSSPVLGVGFGEFGWNAFVQAADLAAPPPPGVDRHSHDLFLQLLAETGLAGLLCVLVPLILWLRRAPWRKLAPERCWAIAVLAIIGLHSLVEFPLWHANFLGLFALLFGVTSAPAAAVEPTRLRRGAILLLAVAGGLAVRSVWTDYRAFERWYLAVEAKGARGARPDDADLQSLMALHGDSIFAPYIERIASEEIEIDDENVAQKLEFNSHVVRLYPVPSVVFNQLALLALAGREDDAGRMLRAAVRVYPQWTPQWLPRLEQLARGRPERFSALLAQARAQAGRVERGETFAPLPGTR